MKIIFAHDHKFSIDEDNQFYSPGKLNNNSFSRYFHHFDSITILSRFIVSNSNELRSYNKIDSDGINFIGIDNQSSFVNRFLKRHYYSNKIKKILSEHDALVVRVPSEIGFLAAKVAKSIGIPYVCEVVACPEDAMDGIQGLKPKLYKPLIVHEMKQCVKDASGAIYVTNQFLQKKYPCSGFVQSASNVEINDTAISSKKYSIEDKPHVEVCLIGNLDSPHKGYETLFNAIEILEKSNEKTFTFYLVGSGEKYKRTYDSNKINIVYTGALSNEKVIQLLDKVDIYIQPSNQEGLPRATIEAMSRGLPCIVSNAGGLPELVDEKFIHNINDHFSLAELLKVLVRSNIDFFEQSKINLEKSSAYLASNLFKSRNDFFSQYVKVLKDNK